MLCINLPYNQPEFVDSSLCCLIDAPDTVCCRSTFLVNPSLSSDSEAVNYSVNLNFIRVEINYMKFCLLDFNGYSPAAVVLNYLAESFAARHAKRVAACSNRTQHLLFGSCYQIAGVNFEHLRNRYLNSGLPCQLDWEV